MATKNTQNLSAVILVSGKQHLVKVGDKISAEKITASVGDKINVKEVLLLHQDGETEVGTPFLSTASVELQFDGDSKADKVEIRKFRAKSRYRRTTGHRQTKSNLTVLSITQK